MNDERRIDKAFSFAERYSRVESFAASSEEVCSGAHRLDGIFYGDEGYQAKKSMTRAGFCLSTLSSIADVQWPGSIGSYSDFRRVYVNDEGAGAPFFTTSDMMQARHSEPKLVSRLFTFPGLKVAPGAILISGSGTIGNTTLAAEDFCDAFVSHDAFRVIPSADDYRGLLYCFLQSAAGQFLLTRNKSGGVVEHIYEDDINTLAVPILPRRLRDELTNLIDFTSQSRVKANRLLDEAESGVYRQNYLETPRRGSDDLEIIVSRASSLRTSYEGHERIRLDATFQEHRAVSAAKAVSGSPKYEKLGNIVAAIPFTGPGGVPGVSKVDEESGVPYVTSRDLGLSRIRPAAYVNSPQKKLIEDMYPAEGTTLVMCAGTLGETFYVKHNFEGWAVSLDVIRVIPDGGGISAGYVFAFLSCPLGRAQMLRHKYGSVIPRIHSRQVAEVLVPIPVDKGESIAALVDSAFECRRDARESEDRAIALFEFAILRGRAYIEAEWGSEY